MFWHPTMLIIYGVWFCTLLSQALEPVVHGRGRKEDSLDETYMGVYESLLYARKTNAVEGIPPLDLI